VESPATPQVAFALGLTNADFRCGVILPSLSRISKWAAGILDAPPPAENPAMVPTRGLLLVFGMATCQIHVSKITKEPAGTAQRTQFGIDTLGRSPSSATHRGMPSSSYPLGRSRPFRA